MTPIFDVTFFMCTNILPLFEGGSTKAEWMVNLCGECGQPVGWPSAGDHLLGKGAPKSENPMNSMTSARRGTLSYPLSVQKSQIISGMDEESVTEIKKVYDIIIKAGTFQVSSIKTAEAVKVIENSQRDINIAFMNEVAMICDRLNIDTAEVLAGMNTKWNALGFKPGLVGGHCIGVDPYYLTNMAEKLGYHSQIILNGRKVNDSMGAYVADASIKQMIEVGKAPKNASVFILGITFKENCPDARNSKVYDIIKRLREYEIEPQITDPWADPQIAKLEYGVDLIPFEEVHDADCIIVAVGHNEFRSLPIYAIKELYKKMPDNEKVFLDVKSLYRIDELNASGLRFWRL